jgi:outer membrane protein
MRAAPAWPPLAITTILMCAPFSALAQPTGPQTSIGPQAEPVTLPPRVGVAGTAEALLTLQDVIRLTLEQNNDVAVARLEVDAAREDVRAAEGVFDLRLAPNLSYERANTASASAIGGATEGRVETRTFAGGMQLLGLSPKGGGEFNIDFTSSRFETSNQFSRLNPQFPSGLSFNFVQPLLRDRSIDAERRQILLSKRAVDLTDSQLRTVVTEQLTLVEQAYWDLVFARGNLNVQVSALAQARAQVASNERQAVAGTLAPIDVVEAQRQVATFEQTVALTTQTLTETENRLKSLMLRDRQAPLWNQPLVPADPRDQPLPQVSVEEAMKQALSQRPELAASDVALAQNDIDRRFFQNQSLPQLDLVGGYTLSGLAGSPLQTVINPLNPSEVAFLMRLNELSLLAGLTPLDPPESETTTVPGFFAGVYGTSLRNLFERRFPTALIQMQIELPLRNRTAEANVARTRIEREQLVRRRRQLEQAIEVEVRNALQALQTSNHRLAAAASAHRSAQEQYDSERRRFDSGLSTVFLVLERQTSLVTAQASELRARADLNQAVASYHRAVGTTFAQHGVKFQ